jgi:hypothetical protein
MSGKHPDSINGWQNLDFYEWISELYNWNQPADDFQ